MTRNERRGETTLLGAHTGSLLKPETTKPLPKFSHPCVNRLKRANALIEEPLVRVPGGLSANQKLSRNALGVHQSRFPPSRLLGSLGETLFRSRKENHLASAPSCLSIKPAIGAGLFGGQNDLVRKRRQQVV